MVFRYFLVLYFWVRGNYSLGFLDEEQIVLNVLSTIYVVIDDRTATQNQKSNFARTMSKLLYVSVVETLD